MPGIDTSGRYGRHFTHVSIKTRRGTLAGDDALIHVGISAKYPALAADDTVIAYYNLAIALDADRRLRAIFVRTDGCRAISTFDDDAGTYYIDAPTRPGAHSPACLQCSRFGHFADECENRGVRMTDAMLDERRKRLKNFHNRAHYERSEGRASP